MTISTRSFSTSGTLAEFADRAFDHLQDLGYRPGSLERYRRTWRAFVAFAERCGVSELTQDLVEAFLASRDVPPVGPGYLFRPRDYDLRRAMQVLIDMHLHGCVHRRRSMAEKIRLPAALANALAGFERFCVSDLGASPRTMRVCRRDVSRFLLFLDAHGVTDLRALTPEHLGEFMSSRADLRPKTLAGTASYLRSFLRYLVMEGIVDATLVRRVPSVRVRPDERIPDVWSTAEVEALLAAVDRASPVGKRDYAILALAARLGMRAGDIRDLQLDEVLWEEGRIERRQSKTGELVVLPLTDEIGEALIDYLRNGRSPSRHREVFLRVNAPFEPFGPNNNLHSIISVYRRRAGITLPKRSRKGLHSLRHTVATRLLEAKTPLPVISAVMGHLSSETTRIYTKVDIAALREAALELHEVANG
ncbi:MAG: site-specific integrase [Defluviicoccus sp.]